MKKSLGFRCGEFLAASVTVSVSAIIIALAVKLIYWLF